MSDSLSRTIIDSGKAQLLGSRLQSKFAIYENDRRLTELRWARNARQRLGIYDPDVESALDKNRSRAYPKLTRVKCVSMLSRLMNLLFQDSDQCWDVTCSPVPNLSIADVQAILDKVDASTQAENPPRDPTNEEIETAIRELAKERAERLALEIKDQLSELGGNKALDYVALCRKVLQSGIDYGLGILKGPFVDDQQQRRWERDPNTRKLVAKTFTAKRPRYEFTPVWDYYPDMSAKTFAQMDGQFTRQVMSRQQMQELRRRSDFIADQIDKVLAHYPNGNYRRRTYEIEIAAMGAQQNVSTDQRGKFEALVWEGNCSGADLVATGALVPEKYRNDVVRSCVWIVGDVVIKADVDSWTVLAGDDAPKMFHHFVFEEDESTLVGTGLPNIVRDSQMNLCAAVRMEFDNGSISCGINLEVNTQLLALGQDTTQNQPHKIWYRDDDSPQTLQYPAVRAIEIPSHIPELKTLADQCQQFADQETFVGPATGGDMAKGPSEPFRTAAGASLLRGDQALPFKDVVRNFDIFTESVIGSVIAFNRKFNLNPDLRGDFQPVARGATSLIAKEVLGMQLDNLAQTLTEEEKMYFDFHALAKARVRVRDLDPEDIIVDDAEASRREAAEQQKRQALDAQQQRMVEAEIRKLLSGVLKDLSQAGKNSAAAEATTANVILAAMEKGLSPNALAHEVAGTGAGGGSAPGTPGAPDASAGGVAPAAPAGSEGPAAGMPGPGAPAAQTGSANAGFVAAPA